jgi:hypothetical protein
MVQCTRAKNALWVCGVVHPAVNFFAEVQCLGPRAICKAHCSAVHAVCIKLEHLGGTLLTGGLHHYVRGGAVNTAVHGPNHHLPTFRVVYRKLVHDGRLADECLQCHKPHCLRSKHGLLAKFLGDDFAMVSEVVFRY